jgi:hypothetical protein
VCSYSYPDRGMLRGYGRSQDLRPTEEPDRRHRPDGDLFGGVAGLGPITYQWQMGTTPITGATAPNYTTAATATSYNGLQFSVMVSNSAGSLWCTSRFDMILPRLRRQVFVDGHQVVCLPPRFREPPRQKLVKQLTSAASR